MNHRVLRLHARFFKLRFVCSEELLALVLALTVFVAPVSAATRLENRGLVMNSSVPGATTDYTFTWRYMTPLPVGSVDLLFCEDPIPYMPCVTPPGLDVSNAVLDEQLGETGFTIATRTTNHIVLTRSPSMPASSLVQSTYKFTNIKNPTDTTKAFSVRLQTHTAPDASDAQIDFGSVRGQVTNGIVLETQVPPMLVFCMAEQVDYNCTGTNDNYYTDMGQLSATSTLTAQSQMAVGTNASGGFAVTANGTTMAAGTNSIGGLSQPTTSTQGTNQFGINLVANNSPTVGADPEGEEFHNAFAAPGYDQANKYKFVSGDTVAYSTNVSLMKKFTVSYIVNSSKDLHPGVYTTSITYIASGRF